MTPADMEDLGVSAAGELSVLDRYRVLGLPETSRARAAPPARCSIMGAALMRSTPGCTPGGWGSGE